LIQGVRGYKVYTRGYMIFSEINYRGYGPYVVIANFASPHATCLDGLSLSLCKLEVPFCTFHSQKIIFFDIYAPYQLDSMRIHKFLHYNPHTLSLVLKIKNCVEFHVNSCDP
jgi:hypothetical protein